jgi:glutathione S-transferase
VLQYLADRKPEAGLAPAWGSDERYRLIDTLHYLGTEVHKRVFYNIFSTTVPAEAKELRRQNSIRRSRRSPGASATARSWLAIASPSPTPIS